MKHLSWRIGHEGLLLFTADGSATVVAAALAVIARKNSHDVGPNLHKIYFSSTHAADPIGAKDEFVSRCAILLAHHAVAL